MVTGARERLDPAALGLSVTAIERITGRGMKAQLGVDLVHLGKPVLFNEIGGTPLSAALALANERLVMAGRTTMIVRRGERYLGVLGLMDTPRPGATQVMKALRSLGIERLIMIFGDNQRVAESVAREVGLT